jgi:hypothetical protein
MKQRKFVQLLPAIVLGVSAVSSCVKEESVQGLLNAQRPVFETEPKSGAYLRGSSATLTARAMNLDDGTLSVKWYDARTLQPVSDGVEVSTQGNVTTTTLSLTDLRQTQSYYVVATNVNPAATGKKSMFVVSATATLTVGTRDAASAVYWKNLRDTAFKLPWTSSVRMQVVVASDATLASRTFTWYACDTMPKGRLPQGAILGTAQTSNTPSLDTISAAVIDVPQLAGSKFVYVQVIQTLSGSGDSIGRPVDTSYSAIAEVDFYAAKPKITTQPKSVQVIVSDTATLKVVASGLNGTNALQYQWQKRDATTGRWSDIAANENLLAPTNTTTMRLTQTSVNVTGEWYRVKVVDVNSTYQDRDSLYSDSVKVSFALRKAKALIDSVVRQSDGSLKVYARAQSQGSLSYQWRKLAANGVDQALGTDSDTLGSTDATQGFCYYVKVTDVIAADSDTTEASEDTAASAAVCL